MDKKRVARGGNCFADFGHRFCRSLPVSSCPLLPASLLPGFGPKRFCSFLSDCHLEISIIAWQIFQRPCDQSWFPLATDSNCDAHRGKSPKHKSELSRRTLSCVSRGEVSTGFNQT